VALRVRLGGGVRLALDSGIAGLTAASLHCIVALGPRVGCRNRVTVPNRTNADGCIISESATQTRCRLE
jgi:hypothetical protein